MNPIVSVIVPFYNVERYFDKCLNSIKNQTLNNFEIICIDDCSLDGSALIAKHYAREDTRFRVIQHKRNMGVGAARNTGIASAKAPFLVFIDSDDFIATNFLEKLWRASEQGKFDVVCCGFCGIDQEGNKLREFQYPPREIVNIENSIDIFTLFHPAVWNKQWRKSLFTDNDIFFPKGDYFEDMATHPRLLSKSKLIKVIDDVLYFYNCRRSGSITNTFGSKHINDLFRSFELIQKFLEKNQLLKRYKYEFSEFVHRAVLARAKKMMELSQDEAERAGYLNQLLQHKMSFLSLTHEESLHFNHSRELLVLLERK